MNSVMYVIHIQRLEMYLQKGLLKYTIYYEDYCYEKWNELGEIIPVIVINCGEVNYSMNHLPKFARTI